MLFGFLFIAAGTFIFEAIRGCGRCTRSRCWRVLYIGVFGVGLAHFLWWSIVGRLPAITASIGSLLVPVIGVIASTVILGERPTVHRHRSASCLIFAAAACVLLQPNVKHDGDAGVTRTARASPRRRRAPSSWSSVIGLAWGFNWVAARIILTALPPWTMRAVGIGLGALTLFAAAA